MRRSLVAVAGALALTLGACGGDDGESKTRTETKAAAEEPRATPTSMAENVGQPGNGFPAKPQIDERFQGADGLLTDERAEGGTVEPGRKPVYVVGSVRNPTQLEGRAGVYCRGSADGRTSYDLTVDRTGRVRLDRVEDGKKTLIAGYDARVDGADEPGEALPLILGCGRGTDGGITLGFVVGVKAMTYIGDDRPFQPGASSAAGRVAEGAATFGAFQLYIAD